MKRTITSCESCHQNHRKCNDIKPCDECSKRNIECIPRQRKQRTFKQFKPLITSSINICMFSDLFSDDFENIFSEPSTIILGQPDQKNLKDQTCLKEFQFNFDEDEYYAKFQEFFRGK